MSDPELAAMSVVKEALDGLDEETRGRVLRWAGERFGISVGPARSASTRVSERPKGHEEVTEEEISAEAPMYEHFAELFNAASPKTNDDKALVAGYWFQALKGQEKFKATDLQGELKNLGHAVPNITEALTSNIKKKPARVLQLAKSGASKQARKTYKLTHEGLVYVQGLMGHTG